MKKIFCVILVCLFMNSCSRLDLAVQFASTYVSNKADDYFDTTKEQTKWIKANFEKDFKRIQKIIFPQLAAELNKAAAVIAEKRHLDTDEVSLAFDRVKNLAYDSMRIFAANAALFVDTLTPNQIFYFQKEFDKKLKDLKDDDSSKETYKKTKKQFDSWMGNMSSEQKRDLEDFSKANPPLTDEKIANRKALAQEFVTSYQDKNKRKAFMQKFMTKFDVVYEGKFSKASRERNQKMIAVVTTILNKMNNEQRETLIATLKDRANQLIKISRN